MRKVSWFLGGLVLVGALGCGPQKGDDGKGAGDGGSGDGGSGGEGGVPGKITGTAIDLHVTESTEMEVPWEGEVVVGVPAADGTLSLLRAPVASDGTFAVDGVPEGTSYFVRRARVPETVTSSVSWVATDERVLRIGSVQAERPDLEIAPPQTFLELDLEGVDPWQAMDQLEVCSPAAMLWAPWAPEVELPPGTTSFTTPGIDVQGLGLARASAGDRPMVLQLRQREGESVFGRASA